MSNLLDKASILLTPTAYDNGSMLSIKPENGDGDFQFERNSAATRVNAQGLVENVQIISSELVSNGNFSQIGTEEVLNGNFSQEGSELVTNGDFATDSDWSKGSGWSIENGQAICNGVGINSLQQSGITTTGKTYKLTFDIISKSSDNFIIISTNFGDTYINGSSTSLGTNTFYINPTSGTGVRFRVANGTTLTIDNVSVKEVGQNWDTYGTIDADNTVSFANNELTLRNDGSGSGVKQDGFTIGNTYKIVVNVTDIVGNGFKVDIGSLQNITTVGTKTFYLKATIQSLLLYRNSTSPQAINGATITNISIKEVGQDWTIEDVWTIGDGVANGNGANGNTEELTQSLNFDSSKKYKISYQISNYVSGSVRYSLAGGGGYNGQNKSANGTYVDIINTGASHNQIKFFGLNFNGSVTNISVKEITDDTNLPRIDYTDGCGVWLLEGQSTNLYLNSETLSTQSNTTSASTYTVSFYGTGTITFSGTHTGTLVGTAADERVSATFTATSGTLTSTISGTCEKGQLEGSNGLNSFDGSYATSYIPTNGAANTRLQDIANNSGNSSLINSTEGVLYAEISALADDGTTRIISLSEDGNIANRVNIFYTSGSNKMKFVVKVNNSNVFDDTITLSNILDYNKVALRYGANNFAIYINGVKESEQLSGSTYPANTIDKLNFDQGSGNYYFYGKTKAVAVYKEALTDEELQALTTI